MPRTCWIVLQAGEQSVSALYQLSTRPIIPDMELAKLETWLPNMLPFHFPCFFLGGTPGKGIGDGLPQSTSWLLFLQFDGPRKANSDKSMLKDKVSLL